MPKPKLKYQSDVSERTKREIKTYDTREEKISRVRERVKKEVPTPAELRRRAASGRYGE